MDVSQAVDQRMSVRAFTDQDVSRALLEELLQKSARAPSGGNVQPWRVFVLQGEAMQRFRSTVSDAPVNKPEYDIYPRDLGEPYRTSRFKVGEDMYNLLGIPREDKAARLARLAQNYHFFGAPAAFFCYIDRQMGPPQWSDLGMFLQTFMLLAVEAGLGTCAQEAWAMKSEAVSRFFDAPDELMLFCGMAVGHIDASQPVNTLRSERTPLNEFATFA